MGREMSGNEEALSGRPYLAPNRTDLERWNEKRRNEAGVGA